MRPQLLAIATLATGCLDSERDIEVVFRVVDTTGAPRPEADVVCGGLCDSGSDDCSVGGTVAALDGLNRLCTVPNTGLSEVWLDAWIDAAHVSIEIPPRSSDRTLVLWTPTVTTEEAGDDIVIAWDPSPQTPDSGAGGRITAQISPSIAVTSFDLGATSWTLRRDDFEDFDARISFDVEQRIGTTTHDHWISWIDLAHTPALPASRGAACTLTYQTTNDGGGPATETLTFDAGTCPLTDGVTDDFECEAEPCSDFVGVVDLGAEQLVRRVRVRDATGPVAVSTDGVTFTEVGASGDELSPVVTARYVRGIGAISLGEISVFTP
jgi:hypothetical protein